MDVALAQGWVKRTLTQPPAPSSGAAASAGNGVDAGWRRAGNAADVTLYGPLRRALVRGGNGGFALTRSRDVFGADIGVGQIASFGYAAQRLSVVRIRRLLNPCIAAHPRYVAVS
jgi:hypothetical protein